MESVIPVDDNELENIHVQLKNVHIAISMSMSYIRKVQGWEYVQLAQRIHGLSEAAWKRYLQPSYSKMRPLHIVAAYSWLTMVPMPAFYRGLNIKEGYRGMDDASVEAMIHCGILPKRQFKLILEHLYEYLSIAQKNNVDHFISKVRNEYGSLDDFDNQDFMFPEALNIDMFAKDYYRSVALAFQHFRQSNDLSVDTMSKILNLSTYRYQQCEDPDKPISLPVDIAARLKLGFKLIDPVPFTSHMSIFPQFHTVRCVQHIRETKLVELMKYIDPKHKHSFIDVIYHLASIYTTSIKK